MKVKDGFKFGVGFLIAYDLYKFVLSGIYNPEMYKNQYDRIRAFFENRPNQTDQDPSMNTTDVGADPATD